MMGGCLLVARDQIQEGNECGGGVEYVARLSNQAMFSLIQYYVHSLNDCRQELMLFLAQIHTRLSTQ